MNIQTLIRNLDPAKVTPELRAMIAAHMAKNAPPKGHGKNQYFNEKAERQAEIIKLLSDGKPRRATDIAAEIGAGMVSVSRDMPHLAKRHGLHSGNLVGIKGTHYCTRPVAWDKTEAYAEVLRLYRMGVPHAEIAEAVGMTNAGSRSVINRIATVADIAAAAAARYERKKAQRRAALSSPTTDCK